MRGSSVDPFVGRQTELDSLDKLLSQVAEHGARVVRVHGPVGIGKTALLRRFRDQHPELSVLWGNGKRSTPNTSFASICELLGPLGVRVRLPAVRPGGAVTVPDAITVGRQLIPTLVDHTRHRPIVIVLDDAHRTDLDSLRALRYALRDVPTHPVLTVLLTPSDADLPPELDRLADHRRTGLELPIGPLHPAEVQTLFTAIGGPDLAVHAACQLRTHTAGNPRHLAGMLEEHLTDGCGLQHMLPAPRRHRDAVAEQLTACGPEARRLVEAAAVLDQPTVLSTASALAGIDAPWAALDEACAAGLLALPQPNRAWRLTFPDPLVRAAVYQQLGPARRSRLHRLATRLADTHHEPQRPE